MNLLEPYAQNREEVLDILQLWGLPPGEASDLVNRHGGREIRLALCNHYQVARRVWEAWREESAA